MHRSWHGDLFRLAVSTTRSLLLIWFRYNWALICFKHAVSTTDDFRKISTCSKLSNGCWYHQAFIGSDSQFRPHARSCQIDSTTFGHLSLPTRSFDHGRLHRISTCSNFVNLTPLQLGIYRSGFAFSSTDDFVRVLRAQICQLDLGCIWAC